MKTFIKNLLLVPALIAGLALIPAGRVTAQTFTNLHSFSDASNGANPEAGLILSGNTLYGTASGFYGSGDGAVFARKTDGTAFRKLDKFTVASHPYRHNSDGASPGGDLILSGNTLYGTAGNGGGSGYGTVFKVNTNGTSFTNLHSFAGSSGGA